MNQSVHCWDIVTTDLTENEKKRPEIHELSRNIDKKVQIVMELIPGLSKITAEIIVAYAYAINTTSNALRKLQNGDMIIASHLFFQIDGRVESSRSSLRSQPIFRGDFLLRIRNV